MKAIALKQNQFYRTAFALILTLRARKRYILPTVAQLSYSSIGGLFTWPPDELAPYAELIAMTHIESGYVGLSVRLACAVFCLLCWASPWVVLRIIGYTVATVCSGLIFVAFLRAGYGDFAGQWLAATMFGMMAIAKDGE